MAERRMFSLTIVDSDLFLDMPISAQNLYFHLCMRADDDGFINAPNRIMKTIGANKNDMDMLLFKNFVIPFESGVCVIKHWKIHNYIRNDRKKDTMHLNERSLLATDTNGEYFLNTGFDCLPSDCQTPTECLPNVSIGKDRLGKVSLGQDRLGEDITPSATAPTPSPKPKKSKQPKEITDDKISFAEFVYMTQKEYDSLVNDHGEPATLEFVRILDNYKGASGKKYQSDYRAILTWVINKYKEEQTKANKQPQANNGGNFFAQMLRDFEN